MECAHHPLSLLSSGSWSIGSNMTDVFLSAGGDAPEMLLETVAVPGCLVPDPQGNQSLSWSGDGTVVLYQPSDGLAFVS